MSRNLRINGLAGEPKEKPGAVPGKATKTKLLTGAASNGNSGDDSVWQWVLTQDRLRAQLERLRAALTIEEKSLVVLDSRAEYGVAPGEKPLSEGALFKREAMLDKALDRYERLVKEAEKRKQTAAPDEQDPVWLKERAVLMELLQEYPEVLDKFLERMDASETD